MIGEYEEAKTIEEKCEVLSDVLDNRISEEEWLDYAYYWEKVLPLAKDFLSQDIVLDEEQSKQLEQAWWEAVCVENEPVIGEYIEPNN